MSKIKIAQIAGMKLADVVKKLRKRKYAKDSKKNVEKKETNIKKNKTVQELDREKLEKKFPKKDEKKIN